MSENVKAYFRELKKLSGHDLDASAQSIALKEKKNTARLIAHLAEISSRKYYLVLGYRHIFEYCVERLNLSEGSVARRLQVAHACNRYPQLLAELAGGQLNLTTAGLIAPHLRDDIADGIIKKARGKSKRAIQAMLVGMAPKIVFKPAIRKVPTIRKLPASPQKIDAALPGRAEMMSGKQPPQGEAAHLAPGAESQFNILEQATAERYNFRFSADKVFYGKLERLAEILGIEDPRNHMAELLGIALDTTLDRKDPKCRIARRKKGQAKTGPGKVKGPVQAQAKKQTQTKAPVSGPRDAKPGRHIPAAIRERVLEKAGYQCEYRSADGRRCSARIGLQVEHTRPFAVYHSHDEAHLCILCGPHNRLAAERYFGKAFIRNKIEAAGQLQQHGVEHPGFKQKQERAGKFFEGSP